VSEFTSGFFDHELPRSSHLQSYSRSIFEPPPHKLVPLPTLSSNSTSNGVLGEGFSKAFEFAATPGVFAAIGYGVDRLLGTKPFAMIGLTIFAVVGMFVKMWIDYDAAMKVHEVSAIAAKQDADSRHVARVTRDHTFTEEDVLEVAS
jgi:F0F1-type ATP synthase assembly protein I